MRVYLRNQPHPRAPIWLIVGTRHICVCEEFAKWFRHKFGGEAALQDVWEAMTCPAWMLWVTTHTCMPQHLQELMEGCVGEVGRAMNDPHFLFLYGDKCDRPLARKIRLVMPGELLEALLEEEPCI